MVSATCKSAKNVPNIPIRIGMFGLGSVGGGVFNLLQRDALECTGGVLPRCEIVKVYVNDSTKKRDGISMESIRFAKTPQEILDDDSINCIVEVMGGTTLAWEVISTAIKKGKHVITANKTLLAAQMKDLQSLLDTAPSVCCFFEASVCGGIPIIATIRRGLQPDRIFSIAGILNGTSNFVLTEMEARKCLYEQVLSEAQAKGFAEADPSADVEGWDVRSKLCILAKLAFGINVDEAAVPCQGISQIEAADFEYGNMLNHTIKLLGIAEVVPRPDHGPAEKSMIAMSVLPAMISKSSPLALVSGASNAVEIKSENLGTSLLVGAGAGRYPTANSIVADAYDLATIVEQRRNDAPGSAGYTKFNAFGGTKSSSLSSSEPYSLATDHDAEFYIRLVVDDQLGVISKVSEILARWKIPIFSILQTPIHDHHRVPFAIITETCPLSAVAGMKEEISRRRQPGGDMTFILKEPLSLRYFN